jgi:peptidyl-prolyl cis-trans isomerase C
LKRGYGKKESESEHNKDRLLQLISKKICFRHSAKQIKSYKTMNVKLQSILSFFVWLLCSSTTLALVAPQSSLQQKSSTSLQMGFFDSFSKAFKNTDYGPPAESVKATARHILVPTEKEAKVVMKMISSGESTFAECAQDFSTCPSSKQGGSLGSFGPGTMVPAFDKVIFNPESQVGELQGPVLTEFGFHVIVVDKRTGGGDWY